MSKKDELAVQEIEMTYYKIIAKKWGDYYLKSKILNKNKIKDLVSEYEKLFDMNGIISNQIDWPNINRESILGEVSRLITNEIEKYDSIFYIRSQITNTFEINDEEDSDEFYLARDFQSECLKAIVRSLKEYLASDKYKIYIPDAKDPSKCGSLQMGKAIHEWLKNNP